MMLQIKRFNTNPESRLSQAIMALSKEEVRARNRERMRRKYQENPEAARQRSKDWYKNNPDKVKEMYQKSKVENADKIKARSKEYYDANRETLSIKAKEYRENNPDKIKARRKKYYDVTRETRIARSGEWYEANKDRKSEYDKNRREQRSEELKAYYRRYNVENREKRIAQRRQYRENNPVKYLLLAVRSRAKKKGVPFTITEEDIPIPEFCPVLGIPLFFGNTHQGDNSPSVDRINPKLGYVKGNVAVISLRANAIKQNATVEEIRAVADWLEKVTRESQD